jgi:hypothetical protein
MTRLNLPPFRTEELNITPSQNGASIAVVVAGSATAYRPDDLRSYLQQLHSECIRVGAQEVAVDLRALEFMNSAGFSTFIDWLVTLQEEDRNSQYKVRYLSNSEYSWQRRSLHALQCLAVDLVSIDR